jgi:hypothetical protein
MEAARREPARGQVDGLPDAFFADLVDREPPLPEHLKRNLP